MTTNEALLRLMDLCETSDWAYYRGKLDGALHCRLCEARKGRHKDDCPYDQAMRAGTAASAPIAATETTATTTATTETSSAARPFLGPLPPNAVQSLLREVHVEVPLLTIVAWTPLMRDEAEAWARRQLALPGLDEVIEPPRPSFLPSTPS